jgi:hypothetical protein
MTIQSIVEGHGEVEAFPVLLRRFRDLAQVYPLDVNPPIRRNCTDFFVEEKVRKAVRLALKQSCDCILLLVDGDRDNDCPAIHGPLILAWAQAEAGTKPCAVVLAYREYEAWFLASIESLRGQRGIRHDAEPHPAPEVPRDAKGELETKMETGASYQETADQPALSAMFDMQSAYQKCRSFRHLVTVFGELVAAAGVAPSEAWPPADWQAI